MDVFKRAAALALVLTVTLGAVRAFDAKTVADNLPFTVAFSDDANGQYFGAMRLNFNKGVVSGTYNDESPERGNPLANQHGIPVTGTIPASGDAVLTFGALRATGRWSGQQFKGSARIAFGPHKGAHFSVQVDFAE